MGFSQEISQTPHEQKRQEPFLTAYSRQRPTMRKPRAGGSRASHGKPPPRKSDRTLQNPLTCPSHRSAATCFTYSFEPRVRATSLSSVCPTESPPSIWPAQLQTTEQATWSVLS